MKRSFFAAIDPVTLFDRRRIRLSLLLIATTILPAECLSVAPVLAEDFGLDLSAVKRGADDLADVVHLHTKPGPMPDFVRASRTDPATHRFIPVGLPHPIRPLPAKTSADVLKAMAKLDAAAARQRAQSKAQDLRRLPPGPPLDLIPKRPVAPTLGARADIDRGTPTTRASSERSNTAGSRHGGKK